MSIVNNEMILASAGAGKTYALTTRFITLLAAGVAPERIAALTFTRKAAGEFFDEILMRLARAAVSDDAARELSEDVGHPGTGRARFEELLRVMVDAMPRLSLGTLDAFFSSVVRTFPFELGLTGEVQVLDAAAAGEELRRVLGRLFATVRGLNAGQSAMLDAFKLATLGVEEKSVTRLFDRFLDQYHELYRSAPDPDLWGNPRRIWGGEFPWEDGQGDPSQFVGVILDWIETDGESMAAGQPERWRDFAQACLEWSPGSPLPGPITYAVKNVLEAGAGFIAGECGAVVERKRQIPPPAARAAIIGLVHYVVSVELGRRIKATQGIAGLLREVDEAYDSEVRRSGKLTFSDVLQLLGAGAVLGTKDESDDNRRAMEYRLDGRIDHWLLDEFQDTSRRQWDVLEGLIDEAVQDPTGNRSFFYVGDVKQAIFSWRGGDPRLFGHLFNRYSGGGARAIQQRELNRSWRSGEAIIGTINRVFGETGGIPSVFPQAAKLWASGWREHETAVPDRTGQAAVLVADHEEGRFRAALDVILALDPLGKGYSCAVLVQKNDTATRIAEFLRREGGLAALAESDLLVGKDSPWSATFVSLLTAAAFPGDTVAWHHLWMTPAGEWLTSLGVKSPDQLSRWVLGEVGSRGYESLALALNTGLESSLDATDRFSRRRADQLVEFSRAFDENGGGSVAAFLRFLETATVRESEGSDVVRVMTIHKSKGLGFDVVILPDLEGTGLGARRDGPAVSKGRDGSIDWILEYPGELIARHDPRLGAYLEDAKNEATFENLALLYVAMTRAKRGLFAIIGLPGKSTACSYPRLLVESLGSEVGKTVIGERSFPSVHSSGDSTWLFVPKDKETRVDWKPEAIPRALALGRAERRVASAVAADFRGVQRLLTQTGDGADRGAALHALLARVEWSDGIDRSTWIAEAVANGFEELVAAEAACLLGDSEAAEVFRNPGGESTTWRERPMEALIEGVWYSCVVDRVVIVRDSDRKIRQASIFDFKSDEIPNDSHLKMLADRYASQINVYRKVLLAALDIEEGRLRAGLVFTKVGRLVWLSFE